MSLWLPRTSPSVLARYSTRSNLVRYHPRIRAFPRYQHAKPPPSFATKPQVEPIPPVPRERPLTARIWKKVKHEAQHYWHGTKLLVSEVRISGRLQWKILHGETLTRRERRQVSFTSLWLFL